MIRTFEKVPETNETSASSKKKNEENSMAINDAINHVQPSAEMVAS